MASDPEPSGALLERDIQQKTAEAMEAKALYEVYASNGPAPSEVEQELRQSTIRLFNAVKVWREHSDDVEELWAQRGLDQLEKALKTSVSSSGDSHPRLSKPGGQTSQLLAGQVSAAKMAEWVEALREVVQELGLGPNVKQKLPRDQLQNSGAEP